MKIVREISKGFLSCDECNCEIQKDKDMVNILILSDGYKPLHICDGSFEELNRCVYICDRCFEKLNRCAFSTLDNKNKQDY